MVSPGSDLQRLVNENPAGTVFVLQAGTYSRQQITPKDGNQFLGRGTVILDGNGVGTAFGGAAKDVLIQGLIIEDYNSGAQMGAINGYSGARWTVKQNDVRNNRAAGVCVPAGSTVVGNNIHHNEQIGLKAWGAGVVIEGNEIAFNNYHDAFDMNWEAGGTKFIDTNGLIVRNNYVHDNHGAGLWTDWNNFGTVYDGNRLVNNYGPGIFHEISGSAVIRNNYAEGNGHRWYTGGILVANSNGVEVTGNTLVNNNGGVAVMNQSRDSWVARDLWVHHNSITYSSGWTGIYAQANPGEVFTSWNNRFDFNNYSNSSVPRPYQWGGEKSWEEWRAAGLDLGGTRT